MSITNSMVVTNKKARVFLTIGFSVYLIVLLYFLLFAEGFGRLSVKQDYRYNLTLFREIRRYLANWRRIGLRLTLINLLGNIVAFMPFGFCIPLIGCTTKPKLWKAFLASFGLSAAIEITQLLSRIGCCDVDDLFLNTLGGVLGYFLFKVFVIILKKRQLRSENGRISQEKETV